MQTNKLDSVDPMRLAWLLREDLRRGEPACGPVSDWFKMWWAVHGPREYPAWADYSALRQAGLFVPLSDWPSNGVFGMTPALRFLLETRSDLAQAFDTATEQGLWDAIAWLFVHGIREHRLHQVIDESTLEALDATPPIFLTNEASDHPAITWLMFFVWRTSTVLQAKFNLQHLSDRNAYLDWFLFEGVPNLKLGPLVHPRWREWLREPIAPHVAAITRLPRASIMLWQRHSQLQRAFDYATETGLTGLALWFAEAVQSEPSLAWIDQPATPSLPLPPRGVTARPFGLNLIGFAFGELGIGEDVRMAVAACESANIPFVVVNISPGDHLRQADQALSAHVARAGELDDEAPYAINVFCLTGFDTARVALERGKALFDGHYNIGWWPWELPVWPHDWQCVFGLVDEVWAATEFTHRMYTAAAAKASSVPTPVSLMPMAVSVDRVKPMTREALGLPVNRFLFLYVFDFNSYLARKNPLASIRAFRKAFPRSDDSVGLVLKTMNTNPANPEWKKFVRECALDPRITLMDKTLERSEVLGLIQSCNAYISLHRAEGFGRTLAEAMLFGRPVIATNFSGNTDFLTSASGYPVRWRRKPVIGDEYPFVTKFDKAWWSEPDYVHAAAQMRMARSQNSLAFFDHLVAFSKNKFCPATIGTALRRHLQSRNLMLE